MNAPSPYLAAIDHLRSQIAMLQEGLAVLEQIAGVTTIAALPAPPKPQRPPASEPRRAALLKPADAPQGTRHGKVDPNRVRELHAQGRDDNEIAAAIGVTASAILQWRRRLGLAAHGKGGRKEAPTQVTSSPTKSELVNSAATIVAWLRQRGTVIADHETGKTWKVNGRDVIDRTGLLTMANRKRDLMNLPPFQWEFAP